MKRARQTAVLKAYARGEWTKWDPVVITDKMRNDYPQLKNCSYIYANNRYEVQIFELATAIGGIMQMTIIRHGDIEKISWEEIQRAVHELFGPEVSAIEIYPPIQFEWQTNVNLRVVWILPSTWELPFGLHLPGAWGKPA